MLECRIDLIPKGYEDKRRNLATVKVINDGTGDPFKGNYRIEYETDRDEPGETKTLYLKGFDRSKDAGELYKEVFNLIYGEEQEPQELNEGVEDVVREGAGKRKVDYDEVERVLKGIKD